jgi:glycosyltransferase involved in cell wall biosynthesis
LDIVILTSKNEGTPVALIEASAAARPVVGTLVGGVADVINDGHTGFLVPPGDPHAVAERVLFLLNNRQKALDMGQQGRKFVKDRFSAERLIGDIACLYDGLLT